MSEEIRSLFEAVNEDLSLMSGLRIMFRVGGRGCPDSSTNDLSSAALPIDLECNILPCHLGLITPPEVWVVRMISMDVHRNKPFSLIPVFYPIQSFSSKCYRVHIDVIFHPPLKSICI